MRGKKGMMNGEMFSSLVRRFEYLFHGYIFVLASGICGRVSSFCTISTPFSDTVLQLSKIFVFVSVFVHEHNV